MLLTSRSWISHNRLASIPPSPATLLIKWDIWYISMIPHCCSMGKINMLSSFNCITFDLIVILSCDYFNFCHKSQISQFCMYYFFHIVGWFAIGCRNIYCFWKCTLITMKNIIGIGYMNNQDQSSSPRISFTVFTSSNNLLNRLEC